VLHIGLGAFQRAHQAPLFEELAEGGDLRWGVIGVSLRSSAVHDALVPQNCLYSLVVEDGGQCSTNIIGAVLDVIAAKNEWQRVIETIASLQTRLITISVTEKGYNLDPVSGLVDEDDPAVANDLASLERPITMPGLVAAGLRLRKRNGFPPLSILSCDNLAENGQRLRAAVARVARNHDGSLGDWIETKCAFPNSVVDRIVPRTTDEDVARITSRLGFLDLATVRTEPFYQWVIQDSFAGDVPPLDCVGVQFEKDVAPWERAKLRMLNGAHSAMAYLGGLAGFATVDTFVNQPTQRRFVEMLWDELQSTLSLPAAFDVEDYRRALMRRFANPVIGHRLKQIAMDGSQKIPQRLVAAAAELVAIGREPNAIALAIAAWMKWQTARDDAGRNFEVDDPLAATTSRLAASARDPDELASALLSLESIFPRQLRCNEHFQELIDRHLGDLCSLGSKSTLERFVSSKQGASELRNIG
jgi:fructuronate reductase